MKDKTHSGIVAGLMLEFLFVGIAPIPSSRWYPLVLPLVGGAFATYLAAKRTIVTAGDGFILGIIAGLIADVIVVAVGAPLTYLIVTYLLQGGLGEMVVPRSFITIFYGMLIPSVLILLLTIIGGMAAVPIFGKLNH